MSIFIEIVKQKFYLGFSKHKTELIFSSLLISLTDVIGFVLLIL
jgi:hypothetical protein